MRQSDRSVGTSIGHILKPALLASVGMACVIAAPAYAQSSGTSSAAEPPQIVVTGSRIVRRDFTSNSPILTVDSKSFENTANGAVEATLNKLPQFGAGQNLMGSTGGNGNSNDFQPNTNHTIGISTSNLRGLGTNRNLVLVDGHRLTPVNGLMEVDLNTIPSSAIDTVETMTGGASAVYGPDAVSGVVNFKLKKNFRGLTLDTQYGETDISDDQEFRFSALMGTDFADDKGNITIGVERFNRDPAYQNNRSIYTRGWADPYSSNNFFNFINGVYIRGADLGTVPTAGSTSLQVTQGWGNAPAGFSNTYSAGGAPGVVINPSTGKTWPYITAPRNGLVSLEAPAYLAAGGVINGSSVAYAYAYDIQAAFGAGAQNANTTPPLVKALKFNQVDQYLLAPSNRWSAYGSGRYDITDSLEFDVGFNFVNTNASTRQFPPSLVPGFDVVVPYDSATNGAGASMLTISYGGPGTLNPTITPVANPHPVPAALAAALNARTGAAGSSGSPNAPWNLQILPGYDQSQALSWIPSRFSFDEGWTYQINAGLKGKILSTDWTWDLYASYGEATENIAQQNYLDMARWRTLLLQPNWGKGAVLQGNLLADPLNTNFGLVYTNRPGYVNVGQTNSAGLSGSLVTCTSGFYDALFKGGTPSKDCIDAVSVDTLAESQVKQQDVEFNTQGSLFDLPAGPLQISLGASYRSDSLYFRPDSEQNVNSFLDQPTGAYPASFTRGAVYVAEGYGEALVPVLKDLPLIKHFNLELGARYSTYNTTPGGWTYKGLADWGVTDWMRFRGGYNLAVRAPSVGELFEGLQGKFGFTPSNPSGDPCSLRSASPYGAGHANDAQLAKAVGASSSTLFNVNGATGAKNTLAICLAQMGATPADIDAAINSAGVFADATLPNGVLKSSDNGAWSWYNGSVIGNNPAPGTGQPGFPFQGGNTNLKPEIARTWTAGVILDSPFKETPWLARTHLSIDWYSITVNHTIDFGTPDDTVQACYTQNVLNAGHVDNAALQNALNTFACNINQRNSSLGGGNWVSSAVVYTNEGYLKTRGVDFTATWAADFEDIGLKFIPGALSLAVLGNYLDIWLQRVNTHIPQSLLTDYAGTDFNTATLRWKLNTTVDYTLGPVDVSLTWRHLPHTQSFAQRNYYTQLAAFNAGVPFVAHPPLQGTPLTPITGNGLWSLPAASYEDFDLAVTWTVNHTLTLRGGVENLFDKQPPVSYATQGGFDQFNTAGPSWILPTSGLNAPNASLYDTLGRRFYVGLKANF